MSHPEISFEPVSPGDLSPAKRRLLAEYLEKNLPPTSPGPAPVRRRRETCAPLSLLQEQVWLRERSAPSLPPLHNESITIYRNAALDHAALEGSLCEMVRRHEIWRTTFDAINDQLLQVVHPPGTSLCLPHVDLRRIPQKAREAEALRQAAKDAMQPFDLRQGPLWRAKLVTLANEEHRLFITMHQSIVDGVSVFRVLPFELTTLYEAYSAGRPSPLPELPIQYADYAYWERCNLSEGRLASQLAYWRKQLAGGLPVLRWPRDHSAARRTPRAAIRPFSLSSQLTAALVQLSEKEGVTLFMTLLAAFAALLSCYTQQAELIVGTLGPAGRKRFETRSLLGYFVNPIALRIDLSGEPTVRELLRRCLKVVVEALPNDDIPFEYVLRELTPAPNCDRSSILRASISLTPPLSPLGPQWDQTYMDVESGGSQWDLYVELSQRSNGLIGRAQYNVDLCDKMTIIQTLQDLQALLEKMAISSEERLTHLLSCIGRPGLGPSA